MVLFYTLLHKLLYFMRYLVNTSTLIFILVSFDRFKIYRLKIKVISNQEDKILNNLVLIMVRLFGI